MLLHHLGLKDVDHIGASALCNVQNALSADSFSWDYCAMTNLSIILSSFQLFEHDMRIRQGRLGRLVG